MRNSIIKTPDSYTIRTGYKLHCAFVSSSNVDDSHQTLAKVGAKIWSRKRSVVSEHSALASQKIGGPATRPLVQSRQAWLCILHRVLVGR